MGKIILNEIDYSGGNANVIRLTQAEYDALPPTKLTDNNVYMIIDTNGDGSQFQPVIYSEDEREIGVWVDGKPLYEKTYITNYTTTNSEVNIDVSELNIDTCVGIQGMYSRKGNVGYDFKFTYKFGEPEAGQTTSSWIRYYDSDKTINYKIILNSAEATDYQQFTIQYTKTTNTAGSGTWTPQGVPAVHYSTDEKVVGTWIDGSTLYEKTITFTNITIPKTGVKIGEIEIGDNIVEAQGHVIENGGMVYGIPELDLRWYVDNNDILLLCIYASKWEIDSGDLTIKYTKTSQGGN